MMTPLHLSSADLVNFQFIKVGIESDQWSLKVRVIPEMVFQVVVPSVELEKFIEGKVSPLLGCRQTSSS